LFKLFYDSQLSQQEVRAANDRFRELQENEAFKAARCKRCPHCQRIIEKVSYFAICLSRTLISVLQLDGCDAMICGQNYHGGDVQNGCGRAFNWTTAPAYVADVGARRTPAEVDIPAPAQVTP
jgi:hypothetical protein